MTTINATFSPISNTRPSSFAEESHKAILPPLEGATALPSEYFKNKLQFFNIYERNGLKKKDLHCLAKELFEIIPTTLTLTDIVDLIFYYCQKNNVIVALINAILITHPAFQLSPFDDIRRRITADTEYTLNNTTLMVLFKENAVALDKEKLTACYDLAYRLNHPYIYPLSPKATPSRDYHLNFLWVNLNPQDRIADIAQNIFGNGLDPAENAACIGDPRLLRQIEENNEEQKRVENWEKIKKSFTYRISKWSDVHPGAEINLWYDSALVTLKAQKNTFKMMRSISESRGVNLQLRDIRQLSNIDGEIGHSLHPGTQVYYRVDILKALITDHMIRSAESAQFCVVSDIDVEPMSAQQMFDARTLDYLSSAGYVFNRVGLMDNFENSFFIFNKDKEDLQQIHHETIIQSTATQITELRQYRRGTRLRFEYLLDSQFVFKQYLKFRKQMKELDDELEVPRKVVKCPSSQFNFGGNFSESDYQSETFRFIGDSNVPFTRNGRNFSNRGEGQIKELVDWKAEPLPLVDF